MARQVRLEYEGAIYHVMNRGDRREPNFKDDREIFLKALTQAAQKTGWQVHAYCLMNNHFHLVLETPSANLVTGFWEPKSSQGKHRAGATIAKGNDDVAERDHSAVADGKLELGVQPAGRQSGPKTMKSANSENRPL